MLSIVLHPSSVGDKNLSGEKVFAADEISLAVCCGVEKLRMVQTQLHVGGKFSCNNCKSFSEACKTCFSVKIERNMHIHTTSAPTVHSKELIERGINALIDPLSDVQQTSTT